MAVKRKIFLIDRPFQLKFSFFVTSLVTLSSIIYPVTIYELMNQIIAQSGLSNLKDKQMDLIAILVIYQILFSTLVFLICIFQSHKIAGPIYKLKLYLSDIREGTPAGKLSFRKNDNFHDVADSFNETFQKIQSDHNEDFIFLSEITSYINNLSLVVPEDKKPVLIEITSKLTEIQNRFKEK